MLAGGRRSCTLGQADTQCLEVGTCLSLSSPPRPSPRLAPFAYALPYSHCASPRSTRCLRPQALLPLWRGPRASGGGQGRKPLPACQRDVNGHRLPCPPRVPGPCPFYCRVHLLFEVRNLLRKCVAPAQNKMLEKNSLKIDAARRCRGRPPPAVPCALPRARHGSATDLLHVSAVGAQARGGVRSVDSAARAPPVCQPRRPRRQDMYKHIQHTCATTATPRPSMVDALCSIRWIGVGGRTQPP